MTRRRCLTALLSACCLVFTATPLTAHAADELTVLTFNTYFDAWSGIDEVAAEIEASGASVVALQETRNAATAELAEVLGWDHTQSGTDVNLVSKTEITRTWYAVMPSGAPVAGALVDGTWIYSTHLDYRQYGPYAACFDGASVDDIEAGEETRRASAAELVDAVDDPAPSIVMGDFNAPSHLDWTDATAGSHCGYTVGWPAAEEMEAGGYDDAYRVVHPDPAAEPGNTWSPWEKTNGNGQPEPQDRIDYVYYKNGDLAATAAETLGTGESWPSDHSAVLVTFSR